MKNLGKRLLALSMVASMFTSFGFASENNAKSAKRSFARLQLKGVSWGPTQKDVDAAKTRAER
ncbi:MAG: hypothetical protein ACT4O9_14535, partial [Blastocatellia bacterium]